jgi:hypothetical protein
MAFFAGDAFADGVLAKLFGLAESGDEFAFIFEIKLEGVADLAIGSGGLEEE